MDIIDILNLDQNVDQSPDGKYEELRAKVHEQRKFRNEYHIAVLIPLAFRLLLLPEENLHNTVTGA